MKLIELEEIDSTHIYLKKYIKQNGYQEPTCVMAKMQTHGVGSRGNHWTGVQGNLFFSFVIDKQMLPQDLPLQSASIYFSFILKKVLERKDSKIWLKWPNDFYIDNKKIGGTITSVSNKLLYCGIGLNLIHVDREFGHLDIKLSPSEIVENYLLELNNFVSWKNIFSEFVIEFQKSRFFSTTINGEKKSLEDAILNFDGSISLGNIGVFSLR